MNKLQEEKLRRFVEDNDMFNAVFAGIQEEIKKFNPAIGKSDDDVVIGQKYRAFTSAIEIVGQSFNNLVQYKGQEPRKSKLNLER